MQIRIHNYYCTFFNGNISKYIYILFINTFIVCFVHVTAVYNCLKDLLDVLYHQFFDLKTTVILFIIRNANIINKKYT